MSPKSYDSTGDRPQHTMTGQVQGGKPLEGFLEEGAVSLALKRVEAQKDIAGL